MPRDFLCFTIALFLSSWNVYAGQVEIYTLDSLKHRGTIANYEESPPTLVLSERGKPKKIPCADIIRIVCNQRDVQSHSLTKIVLNDNSIIYGRIDDGNPTSVRISSDMGSFAIELTKINRIFFDEIEATKGTKESENDVLYFKSGDVMTGLIERFGKGFVEIQHDQLGKRQIYFDKLAAIHFAVLESPKSSTEFFANIVGLDSSSLSGKIVSISNNAIHFEVNYLQSQLNIPLNKAKYIFFKNGRFVYLSDLSKENISIRSIPTFTCEYPQVRFDQNQRGGPLVLNGATFYKGIGTLPPVEITINLHKEYTRFRSYVGIDDSWARDAQKDKHHMGGNAEFKVFVDDKEAYQSGVVNSYSGLLYVDVDLTGKNQMKLVVSSAHNTNIGDIANWAEAILVK